MRWNGAEIHQLHTILDIYNVILCGIPCFVNATEMSYVVLVDMTVAALHPAELR